MNRQKWIALILSLTMVGGTAGLLVKMKAREKLGVPGVKVTQGPVEFPGGKEVTTNLVDLPSAILDYKSKRVALSEVELQGLPGDTVFGRRVYKSADGFETLISVVLMGNDRTSIHPPQYCLVGQGWKIEQTEETSIPVKEPSFYSLSVMKLTVSRQGKNQAGENVTASGVYVYWFVADKLLTARHGTRMWWMARDLFRTGTLERWAYVTYFSVCQPGQENATYERMKKFIAASVPEFQLTTGPDIAPQTASIVQGK